MNIFNKSALLYSLSSTDRVNDICKPLQNYLGIKCFGYLRLYNDCSFLTLINGHKEYITKHHETIKTQDLHFTDTMKATSEGRPHFLLWPKNHKKLPPILSLLNDHNIWHGLSIYYRHKEYIECFSFAFDKNDACKSQFYLRHFQLLAKFCDYFKIQAKDLIDCSDKNKLAKYQNKFDISYLVELEENRKKFLAEISDKQYYKLVSQSGKLVNLTKRESDCIKIFMQNRTAKEIAATLNISPRTVEHYIESVKQKLEINYKSQLVNILQSNPSKLIEF